jgi:hypothetical protein
MNHSGDQELRVLVCVSLDVTWEVLEGEARRLAGVVDALDVNQKIEIGASG